MVKEAMELSSTEHNSRVKLQVGLVVKGIVHSRQKRTYYVKVGNVICILPSSEISHNHPQRIPVGTEIEAVVVKVSDEHGVMLSVKRATVDPWKSIDQYRIGQRVSVKVTKIYPFGAIVELESNVQGLIHITELSINGRALPQDVVEIGQILDAEILSIDKERRRIDLSMKKLMENPWEHVLARYYEGQTLRRKVINIVDYGAFFEIEPGLEALLHRTAIGLTESDKMKDHIAVGDEMEVVIHSIDLEKKRMSLQCGSTFTHKNQ